MTGVSGRPTAKLQRPRVTGVYLGDRAEKVTQALTRGGLASSLKGGRRKAEREVSRGRSSRGQARQGVRSTPESLRTLAAMKDRTRRRVKTP